MIYGVTALIFGMPNVLMLTRNDDGFLMLLITSLLVVIRYISYIKIAGFALLDPAKIKKHASTIAASLWMIALILIGNAGFLLYRFELDSISVVAVCFGSLASAGVLITYLVSSWSTGLNRTHLMHMVSGVLIALGIADICINTRGLISPAIGTLTLFLGIYTERKSLLLAVRQTLAAVTGSLGAGISVYFLRWYLDPGMITVQHVQPVMAIVLGMAMAVAGLGYYFYARRQYIS